MEARKKKLPIGIENFEEIRTKGFYYVDKTGLIRNCWRTGEGNVVYPAKEIWKNTEYEHVEMFL